MHTLPYFRSSLLESKASAWEMISVTPHDIFIVFSSGVRIVSYTPRPAARVRILLHHLFFHLVVVVVAVVVVIVVVVS